jgi:hypothetical protein
MKEIRTSPLNLKERIPAEGLQMFIKCHDTDVFILSNCLNNNNTNMATVRTPEVKVILALFTNAILQFSASDKFTKNVNCS